MTRTECLERIEAEGLRCYRFFDGEGDAQEIVIRQAGEAYVVYANDARACAIANSRAEFDREEDALQEFLDRLRLTKALAW